jgi:hypothetical protein
LPSRIKSAVNENILGIGRYRNHFGG